MICRISASIGALLLLLCADPGPLPTDTRAAIDPQIACGAVMSVTHGNATLLVFDALADLKDQQKQPAFKPQISLWKPSVWEPGTSLNIRFLDGDPAIHQFVMEVANEWTQGLNVSFQKSGDTGAQIRVSFSGSGVWSKVGRLAEQVAPGLPTMGLGGLVKTTDLTLRRAYVLHEFGHALGALHEHQRPKAALTWIEDVVFDYYLKEYGWGKEEVVRQVISPLQQADSELAESPEFDPASVMMYPVLKTFTKQQFVQPWNSQLSAWDRKVAATLYK